MNSQYGIQVLRLLLRFLLHVPYLERPAIRLRYVLRLDVGSLLQLRLIQQHVYAKSLSFARSLSYVIQLMMLQKGQDLKCYHQYQTRLMLGVIDE